MNVTFIDTREQWEENLCVCYGVIKISVTPLCYILRFGSLDNDNEAEYGPIYYDTEHYTLVKITE